MKDLRDQVAFITSGGSGVALGQAKVFADAGMKVAIADIRQDHLDEAMAYFREKKQPAHPNPKDDPGVQARMAAMRQRRAERDAATQR
jgi:NADP-dependent 3-hydroxy acid dehydrogenase YdfG